MDTNSRTTKNTEHLNEKRYAGNPALPLDIVSQKVLHFELSPATRSPTLYEITHFAQSSKMGTVTKVFDARLRARVPESKKTKKSGRLARLASNP